MFSFPLENQTFFLSLNRLYVQVHAAIDDTRPSCSFLYLLLNIIHCDMPESNKIYRRDSLARFHKSQVLVAIRYSPTQMNAENEPEHVDTSKLLPFYSGTHGHWTWIKRPHYTHATDAAPTLRTKCQLYTFSSAFDYRAAGQI